MGKRLLYKDVKKFIEKTSKSGCKLLTTEYVNAHNVLEIKCKCGRIFNTNFNKFKSRKKQQCNICSKKHRKDTEFFKNEVYILVGDEYSILSEYVNAKEKIKIRHNKCNHEYAVDPDKFLQGRRCPNCFKQIPRTKEDFERDVYNLVGDEFSIISKYINTKTRIKIKHNTCGYEFYNIPKKIIQWGITCPSCSIYNKTDNDFKNEVYSLVTDEYSILGEYKNNKTKIKIKHNNCGHEWYITPHNFLRGNRCPRCQESKNEKIINNFLTNNEIKFERQYKIKDCKDKRQLPFDFAIFDNNDNLYCLLEYDGIHHEKIVKYSKNTMKNIKRFITVLIHDEIKTKYCQENNITLIRICYKHNTKALLKELFINNKYY